MTRVDYGVERRRSRASAAWTVAGVVLAFVLAYLAWRGLLRAMEGETVRNAPTASQTKLADLPAGAANISYYRGGAGDPVPVAFECDVDVDSFRAWAKSHEWPLEERAGGDIRRFDGSTATIDRGLFYQWTHEDAGRYAAYDLDRGRAYFYRHTR